MDGNTNGTNGHLDQQRWFLALDRKYRRMIEAWMRKKWHRLDEGARDDVFNEALAVLFKRVPNGHEQADASWVQSFLFTTAQRICQGLHRKASRQGVVVLIDGSGDHSLEAVAAIASDPNGYDEFEELYAWRLEIITGSLRFLKERERQLVVESHLKGTGMPELAERFGYASARSASKAKCLAFGKLRRLVFLSLAA